MTKKISEVHIILCLFAHTFPYPHTRDFTNFSCTTLQAQDICFIPEPVTFLDYFLLLSFEMLTLVRCSAH